MGGGTGLLRLVRLDLLEARAKALYSNKHSPTRFHV